jgi:hypothetical protein
MRLSYCCVANSGDSRDQVDQRARLVVAVAPPSGR